MKVRFETLEAGVQSVPELSLEQVRGLDGVEELVRQVPVQVRRPDPVHLQSTQIGKAKDSVF